MNNYHLPGDTVYPFNAWEGVSQGWSLPIASQLGLFFHQNIIHDLFLWQNWLLTNAAVRYVIESGIPHHTLKSLQTQSLQTHIILNCHSQSDASPLPRFPTIPTCQYHHYQFERDTAQKNFENLRIKAHKTNNYFLLLLAAIKQLQAFTTLRSYRNNPDAH